MEQSPSMSAGGSSSTLQSTVTARLGRFEIEDSIRVFETYSYMKPKVELVTFIQSYINEVYVEENYPRSKSEYGDMRMIITQRKEKIFEQIAQLHKARDLNTQPCQTQECLSQAYDFFDAFEQVLTQFPRDQTTLPNFVGKESWNKYMAQPPFLIRDGIEDILIQKEFSDSQSLALISVQLYSLSNEQVVLDILSLFHSVITDEPFDVHAKRKLPIIQVIIMYCKFIQAKIDFLLEDSSKSHNLDAISLTEERVQALLTLVSQILSKVTAL